MDPIFVREPIWRDRSVGIAEDKINPKDYLLVKIEYRDRNGNELYPYYLMMGGSKALKYPIRYIRGSVKLRIIPIKDFKKMKLKSKILAGCKLNKEV